MPSELYSEKLVLKQTAFVFTPNQDIGYYCFFFALFGGHAVA
jgi:hypothetical protein